jgi:hypothetical protein
MTMHSHVPKDAECLGKAYLFFVRYLASGEILMRTLSTLVTLPTPEVIDDGTQAGR